MYGMLPLSLPGNSKKQHQDQIPLFYFRLMLLLLFLPAGDG